MFYVFVYTMCLKRRTSQNIVWGGIAGCFPPLIGWTAVTGSIAWPPFILFADRLLLDPAAHLGAGPALPRGLRQGRRADAAGGQGPRRWSPSQILVYSVITVAVSLRSGRSPATGWLYPLVAAVAGAALIWESIGLLRRASAGLRDAALRPMRLFHWSNSYLALVFVAAAVDPLLL